MTLIIIIIIIIIINDTCSENDETARDVRGL